MKPPIILAACLALFVPSPAAAQRPLATPPTSPQFLSRFDFHLSAAALANDDPRFSWDTQFGGDIDVLDYVYGRTATVMDYEAVLGNELRPFDVNQGNYLLEVSTSYRIKRTEVAGFFHHVSRHLSDRSKDFPIAWNLLGLRVLRAAELKGTTIEMVADFSHTTQKVNVDYRWSSNADVVVRRQFHRYGAVYARGTGHLMSVVEQPPLPARQTQTGGVVEAGLRFIGEAAAGELFVGYEHRFDAYPVGFEPGRWFMVGFRVVRR